MNLILLMIIFIAIFLFGFTMGKHFIKSDGFIIINKTDDEDTIDVRFGLNRIPNKKYVKLNVENRLDVP